jgi:hypothetical protein
MRAEDDALDFWKKNQKDLASLIPVALDYLCIQTSAADIERLWSQAGKIITKSRNRLDTSIASKLIFSIGNYSFMFQ